MELSFEDKNINVNALFNMLLYPQIKWLAGMLVICFVLELAFKPKCNNHTYEITISVIWYMFKSIIYGYLAALVFFFNFETKKFVWWNLPDKMLLSTAFVGLLAIYEAVSNLLEIIKCFYHLGDNHQSELNHQ